MPLEPASMLAAIEAAAAAEGFELGASQRVAAERLSTIGAALAATGPRSGDPGGLYLWGPVGRGKTWLLDRFYECVPVQSKVRLHFQRFFRDYHAALAGLRIERAAVAAALDRTIGRADLVCFDEFYAHEPGDATLLTRLLEELIVTRKVGFVVTSNYPPHGLLPDAELRTSDGPVEVRQAAFRRGIELLESALDAVEVDDGIDFRLQTPAGTPIGGFRSGHILRPGSPEQITSLLGVDLARAASPPPIGLAGGRRAHPQAVHDRCIWFGFDEICGRPIGAGDVLGLTSRYTTWIVTAVPRLRDATPESAQRFVNLVDVLHDTDTRLVLTSAHDPEEIVAGAGLPPDAARARSRLSLLRR